MNLSLRDGCAVTCLTVGFLAVRVAGSTHGGVRLAGKSQAPVAGLKWRAPHDMIPSSVSKTPALQNFESYKLKLILCQLKCFNRK